MIDIAHVFPDTNVLLHFEGLDGLDWCDLCGSKEVILHITQPLLAELNKAKDAGGSTAVRKRAKAVQRRLQTIHRGGDAKLPTGIAVEFSPISPDVSSFPGLNSHVADDVLLAAVLFFKQSAPDAKVFLTTDDDGFGLRVKCGSHGVEVVEPPEHFRLDPEPDERDTELRRLRKEVETLRNARPKLAIQFVDGKSEFRISGEMSVAEAKVQSFMEKLRGKYQELRVPERPKASFDTIFIRDMVLTPEKVAAYNRDLAAFYVRSEQAVRNLLGMQSRTIFFALVAANAGSAPATDLSIRIHFPDGFVLREKDEWEKISNDLPRPPQRPTSPLEQLASINSHFQSHVPYMGSEFAAALRTSALPGPSLSIRRTNSYDVKFTHPKLKHGHVATLGEFALTFDSAPFSFHVEYSAVADNVPEILEGKLHFVADAEQLP